MAIEELPEVNYEPEAGYVSTTNACKLCAPLGACLVYAGVEGAVPLVHGSQGCSTYIRRYIISHFNEPMDVASSNFSESSAIFGGGLNLKTGLENVTLKYNPKLVGIATSCLAETLGEDVSALIKEYRSEADSDKQPAIVNASTPSYAGTHTDGFYAAVKALVDTLAKGGRKGKAVNVFPGLVSPADIRFLKSVMSDYDLDSIMLPDYSDTLDGPSSARYYDIPPGGTPVERIEQMGKSRASLQIGLTARSSDTAAGVLRTRFRVPVFKLSMPVGVRQTDRFFDVLSHVAHMPMPCKYEQERGRLIDSYVDGHKYIFGKRAVIYGEEDLVASIAAFLAEIGIEPVLCASGGESGRFASAIKKLIPDIAPGISIREGVDFYKIAREAESLKPDILIGNSKGYQLARQLNIPLVRVGFPIHDRLGGQRITTLGYSGTQSLFDRIVNAVIEKKQNDSPVGYSYM